MAERVTPHSSSAQLLCRSTALDVGKVVGIKVVRIRIGKNCSAGVL